jgi:hypothetical protein
MKICGKCKEEKEYQDFSKMSRSKDGYQSFCKICHRSANKKSRVDRINRPASVVRSHKECLICNTYLPVSQFGKNRQKLDKLMDYCKPCWSRYVYKAKKRMI